ncbi:hypothetical protein [Antarctobacter sp.]|uniref:hypothetical protein n=1 Tax=Antarctobacter sp. TaxID=1872577 RepID=UPI002B27714B|nr:hypothetical protein [Antarctobacter sp.]
MRVGHTLRVFAIATFTFAGGMAHAADPVAQHNSTAFWFVNWFGLTNAKLDVVAPSGEMTTVFAASGTPVFELDRGKATDGVYSFELTAATEEKVKIINPQNNGRGDKASDTAAKSFYLTGQFVVSRGVITTPDEMTEEEN